MENQPSVTFHAALLQRSESQIAAIAERSSIIIVSRRAQCRYRDHKKEEGREIIE